jgi:hypothetical protein
MGVQHVSNEGRDRTRERAKGESEKQRNSVEKVGIGVD